MKILYLADQDLDNESGVSQKISMQSQQWKEEGHEVRVLSLESLSFFSVDGKRLSRPMITVKRAGWKIFLHLLISSCRLGSILKDIEYDLVYMRYRLYSPFFKRALKGQPQIVEINSDDISEYKQSSPLLYWYNKLLRRFFLDKVDGFASVSQELIDKLEGFKKPSVVIANGADVRMLRFQEETASQRPSLVFVGSANQPWHGIEEILYMSNKLSDFDFHIIGPDGINTPNLFYHGYLPTAEVNLLVQKFDVGISTLSLYKNEMTEASPLKTRQYLAQGLPIIYAYDDTDIRAENGFSLKISNNKNNVVDNIDTIRSFINSVYKNKEIRKEAREFSRTNLDITVKEKNRLSFFGTFL